MDLFEINDAHGCIDLCRVKRSVAEQLLDMPDVGMVPEH